MIEQIANIGKYVRKTEDIDLVDYMVNEINTDNIKIILNINVKQDNIETYTEDFYKGITQKALFYQAGNEVLGGAIRLDYYKEDEDENEKKKFVKKIKSACEYCGIVNRYENIKDIIYSYIGDKGKDAFAVIKVDGKYPNELFEDKFLNKMYSTTFNSVNGQHICHICGKKDSVYNSVGFKFYTNDKEVYGNVDDTEKSGVVICRECLDNIIVGKKYVEDILTTYWLDKSVMFLPHTYDEDIAAIYESSNLADSDKKSFIDSIRSNEEDVLDEIGKTKSETGIIFFDKKGNKTFYIYHNIRSVFPSRFSFLSKCLKEYHNLKLFVVIKYATAINLTVEGANTNFKEKMKFVDAMFAGRKIERNIFFQRCMNVYKDEYMKNKHKEHGCINSINKIYNFLVDCGCLEGGWNVMKIYKNYEELFNENAGYFNYNEKKAWFLVGKCYDLMNYYIKSKNSTEDQDINESSLDRTSLDKNFFFARKFDFRDFIYFCNLLNDKSIKYKCNTNSFSIMLNEAKNLMAKREGKLSCDEAKYVFFWGMDSYFEKAKKNDEDNKIRKEIQN